MTSKYYCFNSNSEEIILKFQHHMDNFFTIKSDFLYWGNKRKNGLSFGLCKKLTIANSFFPIFYGKITFDDNKLVLSGRFGFMIVVRIVFICLYFLGISLLFISLFKSGSHFTTMFSCIFLGGVLVFDAVGTFGQKKEKNEIMKIVTSVCQVIDT